MIVLGLTGSIAMGKSTAAQMFRDQGIPVHDADTTVHQLYQTTAVEIVERLFPGTTNENGVDRQQLANRVLGNADAMRQLEEAIHPLVRAAEQEFLEQSELDKHLIVVLDIPLLFETGAQNRVDGVVVVTAPEEVQRRRAMERPGMTEEKLQAILARQTPDREKRRLADFIIDTGEGMERARERVRQIIAQIRSGKWKPRTASGRQPVEN